VIYTAYVIRDISTGAARAPALAGAAVMATQSVHHHTPAVTDDAVALHLPKAQASITCTTLHRLAGQDLGGAPAGHDTAAAAAAAADEHAVRQLARTWVKQQQ
jgi:hypothetical protein